MTVGPPSLITLLCLIWFAKCLPVCIETKQCFMTDSTMCICRVYYLNPDCVKLNSPRLYQRNVALH